ncbi:interleukin-27 receptor subunit alpha isoform X4 [Engystomops pustulosus]|uniref:interleukin-27 receptor subunit alpha isoform X4 n=1 Tax=Engystomops pustulosus TaxID=76066 RepID=UPI003AFAE089
MSGRLGACLCGFLILNFSFIYGLLPYCFICCVYQHKSGDLNCSWISDVRTKHSVSLEQLGSDESVVFAVPSGQNWLIIPRENLTTYKEYYITVTGGDQEKSETFTYSEDGANIFIRPPILTSSILENQSLEITWTHPEDKFFMLEVELRYRVLGAQNWTVARDHEITAYELKEPLPYTEYEFQIRYLPDEETTEAGSLWSQSHIRTSHEMAPDGSCDVWRSLQNGSSLLVIWKELDHRSARGKILSYQVTYIHGREEEDELPCCNVSLPAPATHVCVRARNSEGLGPPACAPPLCADRTFLDCNIHGDSSNRIRVLCKDPVIASPLLSFVVEWRAQREDLKMELDWTRTRVVNETLVLPGDFTPGTPYHVSVYVLYSNSCITGFSTEVYSREEVPTASPKFTSHILSPGSVLVSWEEIPKWHKRGAITHYSIYVRSADHLQDHPVSNGSGNKTLSGLSTGTVYTVWMTASTSAGEGQPGAQKTFQTSAGHRHRVPLIVAVVVNVLFICGAILCFCDCKISLWPKVPKPEVKFKQFFMASSVTVWQPPQISNNPMITVVEEVEPPPKPPSPEPQAPSLPGAPSTPPAGPAPQVPSAAPQGPSAAPQGPPAAPKGPSAAPQGPPAAPQGPSAAPQGPSAAPQGPSAAPQGPSAAPQGPSAAPQGPSAAPQGPSAAPQPSLPLQNKAPVISSGYEKHFMPTPEELMAFQMKDI